MARRQTIDLFAMSVHSVLQQLLGQPVTVRSQRPLSGGCISEVSLIDVVGLPAHALPTLDHGRSANEPDGAVSLVLKQNDQAMLNNFQCEAEGLAAIRSAGMTAPEIISCQAIGDRAYLLMQYLRPAAGGIRERCEFDFGRDLATLHQQTAGDQIGWHQDNYLGASLQPNQPCETWASFVAKRRIGFQLKLAQNHGLLDHRLRRACQVIMQNMSQLLAGRDPVQCLLHGDLWSGNYLLTESGRTAVIDPATYYGCREAEWGMIKWFGQCGPAFTEGYESVWPLPTGWQIRSDIYLLYHQLNHLNLFGSGYDDLSLQTAQRILSGVRESL